MDQKITILRDESGKATGFSVENMRKLLFGYPVEAFIDLFKSAGVAETILVPFEPMTCGFNLKEGIYEFGRHGDFVEIPSQAISLVIEPHERHVEGRMFITL